MNKNTKPLTTVSTNKELRIPRILIGGLGRHNSHLRQITLQSQETSQTKADNNSLNPPPAHTHTHSQTHPLPLVASQEELTSSQVWWQAWVWECRGGGGWALGCIGGGQGSGESSTSHGKAQRASIRTSAGAGLLRHRKSTQAGAGG